MISELCTNHDVIRLIMIALMIIVILLIFFFIVMRKIYLNYEEIKVQNKVLQRDLELNTMLKHEHIQKLLCPHDLITFNNEHIYTIDKCSMCNKQCKRECWAQYFIDKLKHEESVDNDGFFFVEEKKQGGNENANCEK